MRRFYAFFVTLVTLLLSALPTLAAEGDPLANSVLLPGWNAVLMIVIALILMGGLLWMSRRAKQ